MQSIVVSVNVLLNLDIKHLSEWLQELWLIFMTEVFQSFFFLIASHIIIMNI